MFTSNMFPTFLWLKRHQIRLCNYEEDIIMQLSNVSCIFIDDKKYISYIVRIDNSHTVIRIILCNTMSFYHHTMVKGKAFYR